LIGHAGLPFTLKAAITTSRQSIPVASTLSRADGSGDGHFQLQTWDDAGIFVGDPAAWKFVKAKALDGSTFHQRALNVIRKYAPEEYARVMARQPAPKRHSTAR
jgi:hypothetical protein